MSVARPETFTFTDQEAAALQAIGMARQTSLARASPFLRMLSIAVPVCMVAATYVVDLVWFGGAMPGWLFVTLMAAFLAGMLTQAAAFRATLQVSKRRVREQTRQVFEPRTIRLTEEGIEQAQIGARVLHFWSGIDRVESQRGLIILWAGNVPACAIPQRAFAAPEDAATFLEECRMRATGSDLAPR